MKEAIGGSYSIYIIAVFIFIVFAMVGASLYLYKSFKLNSMISAILEKYEGYNCLAVGEIEDLMKNGYVGYSNINAAKCPENKDRGQLLTKGNSDYCIYYNSVESTDKNGATYYSYGIVTYMAFDMPIISKFSIPVYSKSERIYKFNDGNKQTKFVSGGCK